MTLTAHLITVLLPGVVLDWLLGDPHWMPHPVRWMGRAITWLEGVLRRVFPGTPAGERLAGDAWYFGKKVSKPTIGDGLRPVERADVARACRLMYVTELLTLAAVLGWGTLLAA